MIRFHARLRIINPGCSVSILNELSVKLATEIYSVG